MLQIDAALLDALHAQGFTVGVESNGTIAAQPGIDWLCISPKAGSDVVQRSGNELKLVWPQDGIDLESIETWAFDHFLIQPKDGVEAGAWQAEAIRAVMERPHWRLTTQAHKMLGLR